MLGLYLLGFLEFRDKNFTTFLKRVNHQRDIKVPTGSSPLILINGADAERRRIINENAKKGGFYYIWGFFVFVCVCVCVCVWVCKK